MARTFDELVAMQRAADRAHSRVEELRDEYGPPTRTPWTGSQTETYEFAWRTWRTLAQEVQSAVTTHAAEQGTARSQVESDVKKTARHPGAGG
ncbi:hypothetical protein DMH26_41685 [Streptomyces sp. WAC 05379]|uniref:hypothetical protein n=1 Tax=Streptomyces sp. WAC 05379 TaxID=2203207 RepID=UPI000F73EA27|nr:hypothetical protein [Streptomyces sp. WAC 05379]RSN75762.1 hypothetical protein DMH26_41685 [Streptomyces sp. WAC 05379]